MLDVRLSRAISREELLGIATHLKNADKRSYERTFITYVLPGMKIGAGAWATTHYTPSLEIHIYGLTPDEEMAVKKAVVEANAKGSKKVIGNWLDTAPFALVRGISLYRQGGKWYMDEKFKDGGSTRLEMVKLGRQFKIKNRSDSWDYYLINTEGNLELRDREGLISTASKIDAQ